MTPSCPSLKRRSSGRWRRLIRLQGSEDRTVKDSGTGGEAWGWRCCHHGHRASPGQRAAALLSSTDLGKLQDAVDALSPHKPASGSLGSLSIPNISVM